jgi:glycosyltransferase involved in cell wall biosynthesis
MRVLLCHNNFVVQGGAEVFVHEVARVLELHGHEVAYLAASEEGADTPWREYFPDTVDYRKRPLGAIAGFRRLIYSTASKQSARRILSDFKPDIVHCFAIYTKLTPSILDAFREEGVPVVCSFNDYKHICPNYKLYHHGHVCEACRNGAYVNAIRNRCSHDSLVYSVANAAEAYVHKWLDIYRRNVDLFLFASEFMARKTEEFWGKDTFKWDLLRNPFDATKFAATPEGGDYALYFGRLIDEKGVDILVDAARRAPEVPVVIVGDGPDRGALEQRAAETGAANIRFAGPKWGEEMDEILSGCQYVVVPSLWHENFPYVILQSFAMGKPVVGTDRGGIPELVEHEQRGLIYPARSAAELANCMQRLWDDKSEVLRLGRNAKSYVDEEFNDNRFYDRLVEVYSRVTA